MLTKESGLPCKSAETLGTSTIEEECQANTLGASLSPAGTETGELPLRTATNSRRSGVRAGHVKGCLWESFLAPSPGDASRGSFRGVSLGDGRPTRTGQPTERCHGQGNRGLTFEGSPGVLTPEGCGAEPEKDPPSWNSGEGTNGSPRKTAPKQRGGKIPPRFRMHRAPCTAGTSGGVTRSTSVPLGSFNQARRRAAGGTLEGRTLFPRGQLWVRWRVHPLILRMETPSEEVSV